MSGGYEGDPLYRKLIEYLGRKHPGYTKDEIDGLAGVVLRFVDDLIEGRVRSEDTPSVEDYLKRSGSTVD